MLHLPIPYAALRPFDLNAEQSFGTLVSTLLLVGASAVSLIVWEDGRRRSASETREWLILAVGFAYLAIDESVSLHEALEAPMRQLLHTSGALYYAWVIPYALVVLALTPTLARFLRSLPMRTRVDYVVAASMYLAGAIGFEMLEGRLQQAVGFEALPMKLAFMLEETLEMLGVTWFLAGTLAHLEARGRPLQLTVYVPPIREADREVPLPNWSKADRTREPTLHP